MPITDKPPAPVMLPDSEIAPPLELEIAVEKVRVKPPLLMSPVSEKLPPLLTPILLAAARVIAPP